MRRAGWVYLVATHVGTAALIAMFAVLARGAGSYDFAAFGASAPLGAATALIVFVLALIGFGAKAGLVPLHVWLPEAHAAAPSHVSAVMSGVLLKMGIYGHRAHARDPGAAAAVVGADADGPRAPRLQRSGSRWRSTSAT